MAEHRDRPQDKEAGGSPDNPPAQTEPVGGSTSTATRAGGRRRMTMSRGMPGSAARKGAAGLLATIVSVITTIVVVILGVHILFVIFEANTSNDIVSTVADWANELAWQFKDIFEPKDLKFRIAVNYGLAAAVYLVIGRVIVNAIRRFG